MEMRNHPIRKSIGLAAFYAILIVGIFVIQFRSDSIIRKNIRAMRVTLAETENSDQQTVLKNQFQLTYNGLLFSADEASPAVYTRNGSSVELPAAVVSFSQPDDLTFTLGFSQGIFLNFSLSEDSEEASLSISAQIPDGIDSFSVNLFPFSGYSITEQKARQAVYKGKNVSYSLAAPRLAINKLIFLSNSRLAHYTVMADQAAFSLAQVAEKAYASEAMYEKSLKDLGSAIISEFTRSVNNNANFAGSMTEQTAISYIAAMADAGRYNEGLNTIPESFTKGTRRTYQSAPFFGSMAQMAPTLTMQIENFNNMISTATANRNLEIFSVNKIDEYMYAKGPKPDVTALVSMPASLTDFEPTVQEAAGILGTWSYFNANNSMLADYLKPVLEPCVQKIVDTCTFDGEKIILVENDAPLSVAAACEVGDAFVRYGKRIGNQEVLLCGYMIVNSYVSEINGLDLRTLSELYPILVHNNHFIPHFELLRTNENGNVWAWTCATDINYDRDENLTISLTINFPAGLSHYLFVNGITPFRRIQIYNMDFRTDPQFEIYNSSGYVYRSNIQTLLLKSRHKEQKEVIRLFYRDIVEEETSEVSE